MTQPSLAHHAQLHLLQPYPFERWRQLVAHWASLPVAAQTPAPTPAISLGMGEPRHTTPAFIGHAINAALPGLASYPLTKGEPALRQACADWVKRRYNVTLNPNTEVLPVNGSREALFAFAQAVIDTRRPARVVSPNPFYQIYEGAALLAGAQPLYVPCLAPTFAPQWNSISPDVWPSVQLLYTCSPGNPTGAVMSLQDWRELFELSDRYGFIIASDECYSEIYDPSAPPPLGGLQAAQLLGRSNQRLVTFTSLSKRSNAPGLRSGFVAGDAQVLQNFLLYRTYHGSAMSPLVQAASIAAWQDEAHVEENRQLYAQKFAAVTPQLAQFFDVTLPDAGFYSWAGITPALASALHQRYGRVCDESGQELSSDLVFALALNDQAAVTVLPGSLLARSVNGVNPGAHRLRLAWVSSYEDSLAATQRIVHFCQQLLGSS